MKGPGHPETHATWHKIAAQLAEKYTVVLTDLRGYGDSSKPDGGDDHRNYSFRAMAVDQVEIMQQLGFERFMLAGTVGQMWDVLATWRSKVANQVTGKALPCGHLLPEETPEQVLAEFRAFFET